MSQCPAPGAGECATIVIRTGELGRHRLAFAAAQLDLVDQLGLSQPHVSKHLRVLREVGAVDVRDEGRQRLYRLNGHALKPFAILVAAAAVFLA